MCGVGGQMERTLAFQNKKGVGNIIRVMRPCIFERPKPENDQGLLSENWDLIFKSKMCVYM